MERKDKEAALNKIVVNMSIKRAHAGFSANKSRVDAASLTSKHLADQRRGKFRGETEQPGG